MNTALLAAIVDDERLLPNSAAALKLVEACRRDDISLPEMNEIIARDAALAALLLRFADAPVIGQASKALSLSKALIALGLRRVKILSVGFALAQALKHLTDLDFDFPQYWRRSVLAAVAAREIARAVAGVRRDEAFVGGLHCNLGIVAAAARARFYDRVRQAHAGDPDTLLDIECRLLDVTHAQISALLMARWAIPEVICHAVAAHHGDGFDALPDRARDLAAVLRAAAIVAELPRRDIQPTAQSRVQQAVGSLTGISPPELERLFTVLDAGVRETAELLDVQLAVAARPRPLPVATPVGRGPRP